MDIYVWALLSRSTVNCSYMGYDNFISTHQISPFEEATMLYKKSLYYNQGNCYVIIIVVDLTIIIPKARFARYLFCDIIGLNLAWR